MPNLIQKISERLEKEFQKLRDKAYALGEDFSEWDHDQLVQSAEYANDILPTLRELAGFKDTMNVGTFTDCPNDDCEADFEELEESFEEGYWDNHIEQDEDEE